jgi:hypothetical protein
MGGMIGLFPSCVWTYLACLLLVGAFIKVRSHREFSSVLARLLMLDPILHPVRLRAATGVVALLEFTAGTLLLDAAVVSGPRASVWWAYVLAVTVFLGFIPVVLRARAQETPCGCLSSHSRAASATEIRRSLMLFVLAAFTNPSLFKSFPTVPVHLHILSISAGVLVAGASISIWGRRAVHGLADVPDGHRIQQVPLPTSTASVSNATTRRTFLRNVALAVAAGGSISLIPRSTIFASPGPGPVALCTQILLSGQKCTLGTLATGGFKAYSDTRTCMNGCFSSCASGNGGCAGNSCGGCWGG